MLNPEFKAKWVAALESGEYSQTRSKLHNNSGYCCLGVACVVAGAEFKTVGGNWRIAIRNGEVISDEDVALSSEFLYEIGLTHGEQASLYHMNDGSGIKGDDDYIPPHSFKEIAAWIKENL